MEKYFISPYELTFYLGVFGTVILILFEPFTFLIPCDKEVICHDGHFGNIINGFQINFTSFGYFFIRINYIIFNCNRLKFNY